MDIESGLLLGAISTLAAVVVHLWRRIDKEAQREKAEHLETRKQLREMQEDLLICREKMAARVSELERLKRELNGD